MLFPLSSLEIFSPPISFSLLLLHPSPSCFSGSRTLSKRFARRNIFPGLREGRRREKERERGKSSVSEGVEEEKLLPGKREDRAYRIITTRILSSSVSRFEIRAFLFFSTLLFFSSLSPGIPLSSFSLFLPAMIPPDDVDEERRGRTTMLHLLSLDSVGSDRRG